MVKRVISVLISILMLCSASLALAGGAPVGPPVSYPAKPCGPGGGVPSNYWGDAPFPGLCGGVVALPFLVVGSLLGGNTVGPYGPGPGPGYGPPAPYTCAPPAPKPYVAPCGPGAGYGYGGGGSIFSGLPCLELCSGLLGGIGGPGFLY
ncbi:MAG TPA: hypothetical protein VK463_04065 [Desulfomonilaceae bacterium]|nr:hypothetical protein [Desulfomonilaceae bacterium]